MVQGIEKEERAPVNILHKSLSLAVKSSMATITICLGHRSGQFCYSAIDLDTFGHTSSQI